MAKPSTRTYSRYSRDAARLLGLMIRTARIERKLTVEELAERAGVSRGLVYRAEEGDMGCAIGAVFELATIVGVPLFTPDQSLMTLYTSNAEKTLSLMPRSVYHFKKVINDDF
ncbi:helix-turn-helix transcriptional regulator [Salmonella enterica subsp. enterica serovar Newport]|nr:XRE family transcriptional regulator [Salmonella enterica subsp. enterica serovar Newport]EEO0342482.1 helix-turn-helix domain-containing protein [Salmonella enterica]ECE7417320.1 XRE family transcriptional regulator [Salmonella enterica subsp. enterica serovar Newport]EKD5911799.1 helix-turn-helix transcriptional regulator [Salmonella enterica subsp. enterica serovar Newport]EKD5922196.1 helix-turn-helix transcriptional regulator [Salmonella enterica subsp. enterica serovar Newport]